MFRNFEWRRDKKKKDKRSYYEFDDQGEKIKYISHLPNGRKHVIDLKKRRESGHQTGKRFVITDRSKATEIQLLKEVYQYRRHLGSVDANLKKEIVSRFDSSMEVIDLAFIGAESIVLAVVDMAHKKHALKIALPFELAPGKRTIEEIKSGADDNHTKSILVAEINDFRGRFEAGHRIQDEVSDYLSENGITFFGVPPAKLSDDPILHVVMPWVHGKTILERHNREFVYSLNLYLKILEAIEFIHDFGIIHRDIKASNIMLAKRGKNPDCIYLIDWTLAKRPGDQDRQLTCPGVRMGTPGNASPKQFAMSSALHTTEVDDIYSLGILLFELLHCVPRPPLENFADITQLELYLEDMEEFIPDSLLPIFRKSTAIDEQNRYQRVKDMRADLLKVLDTIDPATATEFIIRCRGKAQGMADVTGAAQTSPDYDKNDEHSTPEEGGQKTNALQREQFELILTDFDCEKCGYPCGEICLCELARNVILETIKIMNNMEVIECDDDTEGRQKINENF